MEYDFKKEEEKIREFWEKEKIYSFDLDSKKKIYSIDTPPPTVSGEMHIGHAFSYSQQDFIARFKRMQGFNVFYPFGTDDNGLPTEKLIERINHVNSKEMARDKFIELCLETLKKITPDFVQQWKNIGVSCDYKLFYSTIDKNSQRISQKSFIDLFKSGKIYKTEFPTLWCSECQTAIAQAELEDKESASLFTTIKFQVEKEILLISTTRPELLSACVAVFVNPEDMRYKKFIGKKAKVPLFEHEVEIIRDKSADMKKGTGAMMICSYGDKFDVDAVTRFKLKPRIIFNKDGTIKDGKYKGLKIKEARKKILEELKEKNLISEQKQISHTVNVHDKCGTEIEFLTTQQWFIKILDNKKEWNHLGEKIKWYPEFMKKRYENWVEGLGWDWTISRDRHFGVPIPVWECKKCNQTILPHEEELPLDPIKLKKICSKCKINVEPETKVFDTWATSSLTPQIISSLIKNKIKIPYSLRPQGHDIIRTWTFYTIVKSFYHEKNIPWKELMVSGFVTLKGEKMSKSKGNVISPKEVIEKYCADALRFWAAGSKLGENMDYREEDVLTGKKFITKLQNASKFVFMNLKDFNGKKPKKMFNTDTVFLKQLDSLIKKVTLSFENYSYFKSRMEIEEFFWCDFCDNYLEIVKWRVYNGNAEERESAFYTLYYSLLTILKLLSPIMPFITEHLYQEYFKKNEKERSIHLSEWPKTFLEDKIKLLVWPSLLEIISLIRQEKTKAHKSMNAEIILTLTKQFGFFGKARKSKFNYEMLEDLKHVAHVKEIKEGDKFKLEFI